MSVNKQRVIFLLIPALFLSVTGETGIFPESLRGRFYRAFVSANETKIDEAVRLLSVRTESVSQAYVGALLMKKANLVKVPGEKLKLFKKGLLLFEEVLKSDPDNAELRFIRLCVQENAPKIVKYQEQIAEDKSVVVKQYQTLAPDIRAYIKDYTVYSGVLTAEELTGRVGEIRE